MHISKSFCLNLPYEIKKAAEHGYITSAQGLPRPFHVRSLPLSNLYVTHAQLFNVLRSKHTLLNHWPALGLVPYDISKERRVAVICLIIPA